MAYSFYVAQVVNIATSTDDRIQVRVLPQMEGIDKDKCPMWPSFFRDELYTGSIGDYVWVICDEEFSMGYVFGIANYNTYPDRTLVSSGETSGIYETATDGTYLSIPKELRDNTSAAAIEIGGQALSLIDAKITYWDTQCIHFIERTTGGKIIAFNNGTLYIFRSNECIIRIGKSIIKLGESSLSLSGSKVQIDSTYVGLGHNACNNVMTNDAKTCLCSIPSQYVFA